ncbi:MAG: M43 family zinc metalloprotease [Fibrobacterota bacterium]|nr:M43 family zinc metalloprotease [Fibrobacterota bacterium]
MKKTPSLPSEIARRATLAAIRAIPAVPALFLALQISACGNFFLDDETDIRTVNRRVYVNDQARNDSLPSELIKRGVKFVLQPSRNYEFSVQAASRKADKLNVYYYKDNIPTHFKTLTAASDGTREIFSFASDKPLAQFFMAQLSTPEGAQAISSLSRISIASTSAIAADTLNVRLMFIRKLRNLPDSASKAAFAKALFQEMSKIYSPFGIVLSGSYDIIESAASPFAFPFTDTFISLPGNRVNNNAHLYLVDSIYVVDPKSGLAGEVLGFSPREVVDLDNHRESRVVLSARIIQGQTTANAALNLAITATHELGHFFGLRHTVSSKHDLLQDADFSNIEDGFSDTRFCNLSLSQLNKTTASSSWTGDPTSPYCFRIANEECTDRQCDLLNLMHPVDCGSRNQIQLSPQQIAFLKKNLATYRH